MKTPWTTSRAVYATLSVVFAVGLLIGVYLMFSGSGLVDSSNASKTPEDWSGVFGIFAEFLGFGLTIIAGVLLLLFGGLYINSTRRLRHGSLKIKS